VEALGFSISQILPRHFAWLWHEWDEEAKPWCGLGTPCTTQDSDLFAAATKVTIGNGKKALFWEAAWINGRRPKDIAPLIFDVSERKKITIHKALEENSWVSQVNTRVGLTLDHTVQYTNLWEMLQAVHLEPNTPDAITWKLTNDGCYSSKTAYNMQLLGHTESPMPSLVWKPWAP
jgi:hypothetical protein